MVWPFVVAAIAAVGAVAWISSELDDLEDGGGDQGRTVNKSSAVEPIPVVYGLRRLAGTRVFLATGGPDNKYLWLAIALCEGQIQGVQQIWIDGKPISAYDAVFAEGHAASAPGADRLAVVHYYRGTPSQSASALLRQAPGWTSAHSLRGVAYLACRFRHAADVWRGVPRVEALVLGRRIYDPRDRGTRQSTNAALVLRDYLTHPIYGGGRPAAEIDDDAIKASADDADEARAYGAGSALPAPSQIFDIAGGCCRVTWLGSAPAGLRAGAVARWRNPSEGSTDKAPIRSVDRVDEALDFSGETGEEIGERWRWTARRRTEAVFDVSAADSTGFSAAMRAGDVTVSASGRHEINAVVDTGKPLIDNVRALLSGCRGMLPWIGGKYTFLIEKDRPAVMDIGPDQLVGPIASAGPKRRDLVNRSGAIYVDPARQWKETEAIWPPAGGAVDRAMLAQDGGERLSRDIRFPTVTSRPQALDLARIVTLRLRSGRRSQARGTPALLPVTPGDIVTVTDATLGWAKKPHLVLGVAHQYGGEIGLALVDHDASVYDWESADLLALHDDTSHRNPLIVPAMAGLAVEVVLDRVGGESEGDPVQWLIGAVATWDAPAAADVVESWISWRTSAVSGTPAGEWETKIAPAGAGGAEILPLRKDVKYDFRGLHRNAYGARSPWSAIVSKTIDKDITAPAPPTGLTLTGGPGLLAAAWTPPASAGFSHVEWELRRFDADGATVAETIEGKHWGTSAALGGLPPGVKYDLRMRSVDDAGNAGEWTGRVEATTLEAEIPVFGPSVHRGPGRPQTAVGAEGDTWVIEDRDGNITDVYGKIESVWTRLSGNPRNAAWSAGSGEPSGGSAGAYYGDRDTGNVWIRHAGGWHWAIDLDPSGELTWFFLAVKPGNSVGVNGNRAYVWRTGLAYQKNGGVWDAFASLVTVPGEYAPVSTNGVYPSPCEPEEIVDGATVIISWCFPKVPAYNPNGSPAKLVAFQGGIVKVDSLPGRTFNYRQIQRNRRVSADTTNVELPDLEPESNYVYAIVARYLNHAGVEVDSNSEADGTPFAGLVTGSFTTDDRNVSVTSVTASGDVGGKDVTASGDITAQGAATVTGLVTAEDMVIMGPSSEPDPA